MSTTETEPERLERIRKLLATAESFASKSKEEGDEADRTAKNYRDKAFELAARYEINRALLRQRPGAERAVVENRIFDLARPYVQQMALAHIVYTTFGCQLISISVSRAMARKYLRTAPTPGRVHAFGFKSDMAQADMLLTSLIIQAQRESVRRYRSYVDNFAPWSCPECGETEWKPIPRDEDGYYCVECRHQFYSSPPPADKPDRRSVWYRSFWNGWVNALITRIETAHRKVQQAAEEAGTGSAIALRSRDLAVKEAFNERYPVTKIRRGRGSKGSGYEAGREAGRQADIGSNKLGASRKGLER